MPTKCTASFASAVAVLLLAGCENSPPGAGLTNGPSPTTVGAEDKPAVRTDLREPDASGGDAAIDAAAEPVTGPSPAAKAAVPQEAATKPAAGAQGSAKPAGETKAVTSPSPD